MPAWLVNLIAPIITYIISYEEAKLVAWIKGLLASNKQKQVDQTNVDVLKKDIEQGEAPDEIAKAGENLLNGVGPKP